MIPAEPAINMQYLCRLFQPRGPFISSFPPLLVNPLHELVLCSLLLRSRKDSCVCAEKKLQHQPWPHLAAERFAQLSTKPFNIHSSKQHLSAFLLWNQDAQTQNPPCEPAEGHSITAWTARGCHRGKWKARSGIQCSFTIKKSHFLWEKSRALKVMDISYGQIELPGDCCRTPRL